MDNLTKFKQMSKAEQKKVLAEIIERRFTGKTKEQIKDYILS